MNTPLKGYCNVDGLIFSLPRTALGNNPFNLARQFRRRKRLLNVVDSRISQGALGTVIFEGTVGASGELEITVEITAEARPFRPRSGVPTQTQSKVLPMRQPTVKERSDDEGN